MIFETIVCNELDWEPPSVPRAGLTILEFMACTIAVIGGAWLGALYLGVDVRHLAFSALSQVKVAGQGAARFAAGRPE